MKNTFVNLTASGIVIPGEGVLQSMYVNSIASSTMVLYHSPSAAVNTGRAIGGIITPGIGYHFLGNIHATSGVYCSMSGVTLDVTFHIVESE